MKDTNSLNMTKVSQIYEISKIIGQ